MYAIFIRVISGMENLKEMALFLLEMEIHMKVNFMMIKKKDMVLIISAMEKFLKGILVKIILKVKVLCYILIKVE